VQTEVSVPDGLVSSTIDVVKEVSKSVHTQFSSTRDGKGWMNSRSSSWSDLDTKCDG
jgi:hypothetical protein